jgi:major membrane immunogen (membrane-anchored lipoprotein)
MRTCKNMIAVAMPEALFLCATSNEDETEGDIADMGYRLAQEVFQFVRENCPGN